ncbi:MAG: sugar porter family MFS transporter [Proteobacteria bacterium]|nr:sugar porter family MFS transporter [Pseudomonadota bacterium]
MPAPPQSRPSTGTAAAGTASAARPRPAFPPALLTVLAVVLTGGLLFGYDQGVISGALAGIQARFGLDPLLTEVVTSWVTLGALLGALLAGDLADRLGRRRAILLAGALFVAGAALQALAPLALVLIAGRLVIGLGVGIAAVAAPLYAAELAPAALRGRFVSAYQLAITAGIFAAYLVDGVLPGANGWRAMLGAAAVPGALLLAAALAAPESPRWLMKAGRRADAQAALGRIAPDAPAAPQLDAIAATLGEESRRATWAEVFGHQWRRPLAVGLGLAIFQQVTGINAVIYYADQIFAAAGFATEAAQAAATTWAIGGTNVLATFIAILFIDRLGRRALLLAGLAGMGASLIVVGIAFRFALPASDLGAPPEAGGVAGIVTLAGLVCFIASFAFSLGPVVWTVINEIFPGRVRGRAVAVATAANWAAAFVVSQTFLSLADALGDSATFWLFAMFCGVGWVWVYFSVPETKGRSLEQIEAAWRETQTA